MSISEQRNDRQHSLVWYASYGSNLSYESRFKCYLVGGAPRGSSHVNPGCRNSSLPLDTRPITLNYEIYFADYSSGWGGAVAFIRQKANATTYGRMYLITDDQFNDVVLQENGKRVDGTRFVPHFDQLVGGEHLRLSADLLYGYLLRVGMNGGYPIMTFTTSRDLKIGAPSASYIKIIAAGLKETYPDMPHGSICKYLLGMDGIRGLIAEEQLALWVEQA